jgi:hypothetical protein
MFGGMLGAMARIAPPQRNEAMARMALAFQCRCPTANKKNLLVPSE